MPEPTPATRMQAAVAAAKPSTSTVASTGAGAATVIILWIVESLAGPIPAPVAAAFTTLATLAAGYFVSGGRSADTNHSSLGKGGRS